MFCYNIALHGPNDIYHQVLAAFAARKCIYSTRAANGKTGTVEGEKSKLFVWLASILPSQPVIGMTILPFSAKSGFSRVGIAWKDLRFRKESPCFFQFVQSKIYLLWLSWQFYGAWPKTGAEAYAVTAVVFNRNEANRLRKELETSLVRLLLLVFYNRYLSAPDVRLNFFNDFEFSCWDSKGSIFVFPINFSNLWS